MIGHRIRPINALIAFTLVTPTIWQSAAAQAPTILSEVIVRATQPQPFPGASVVQGGRLESMSAATSDTASLLRETPGVSLYGAGGVSSLPAIHGLADDRLRVKVDGMDLVASCPNHMNPPLSYLDPTAVGTMQVYAGITPVSVGGDSIGGTIIAKTSDPVFATPEKGFFATGGIGGYYRSNGNGYSFNGSATAATENFSLTYKGAKAQSSNYSAGGKFKSVSATGRLGHTLPLHEVGSTAYDTSNQSLGFAWKSGGHLVEAVVSYQDVPYQLYPNQRMDMLGNEQTSYNLRYQGQFDWGRLEAQAYYQKVNHFMDFGEDKRFWYGLASGGPMAVNGLGCSPISMTCAAGMPMKTRGQTTGARIKADYFLTAQHLLRFGAEFQGFRLDDWWPPSGAGMYPSTFWNINNGERDRIAVFGEWESRLTPQWMTLLGIRFEQVNMNTGNVVGYSMAPAAMGNQLAEATAFNRRDRQRTDNNVDVTALVRYSFDETKDLELGVAHKVRSPNLYERYSWSSWSMAAIMNNFVGDGNGYYGNINLNPEQANTVAATFDWHTAERIWDLKVTPFYTQVANYIDAVATPGWLPNQYNVLRYANQSARLYGLDLSAHMPLYKSGFGDFGLSGLLNYTKGENRDTGSGLYNIMPLNATLTLTHKLGGWNNGLEVVVVDSKTNVSTVRNEIQTAGYTLVNLRASYSWKQIRLDLGMENLFDRSYALPLGGAYLGQGTTMALNPVGAGAWGTAVPGIGRAFYVGLNIKI
jgi:iron complex outermembrane receptor protein